MDSKPIDMKMIKFFRRHFYKYITLTQSRITQRLAETEKMH